MKIFKYFFLLLTVVLTSVTFSACSDDDNEDLYQVYNIVGTWENPSSTLTLTPSGDYTITHGADVTVTGKYYTSSDPSTNTSIMFQSESGVFSVWSFDAFSNDSFTATITESGYSDFDEDNLVTVTYNRAQ